MRLPDSYIDASERTSNINNQDLNNNNDKWYLNEFANDFVENSKRSKNEFNSINPLVVEDTNNFQAANILNKDLNSEEFQDYLNHYKLLDGDTDEINNFYDLENFDISFIYNESFSKIIQLAAEGEYSGESSNKDEFELDDELISIVGMENMILNQSTKRYRVDHMFLSKNQKYELKKYRNRKASKKFRFKKKKKNIGLEKHLGHLIKACGDLEVKLEDLLEENSKLQKEFKVRTMK
ncbi:hypothetical protein QEN19_003214 [Hanseniaspora menglaensis]